MNAELLYKNGDKKNLFSLKSDVDSGSDTGWCRSGEVTWSASSERPSALWLQSGRWSRNSWFLKVFFSCFFPGFVVSWSSCLIFKNQFSSCVCFPSCFLASLFSPVLSHNPLLNPCASSSSLCVQSLSVLYRRIHFVFPSCVGLPRVSIVFALFQICCLYLISSVSSASL